MEALVNPWEIHKTRKKKAKQFRGAVYMTVIGHKTINGKGIVARLKISKK